MDINVGWRLKEIRTSRNLSQRMLAERAGVTNGTISLIEKNATSPSVASLKKVLAGIPMSLSEFFRNEPDREERYFFKADELTNLNEGLHQAGQKKSEVQISFKQVGDASQHSLQIMKEIYPAGTDTGEGMISHEAEEGGIVISGEIEVTVGSKTEILKEGDAYLFDSRLPHRFRNISKEDCVLISSCTPPTF